MGEIVFDFPRVSDGPPQNEAALMTNLLNHGDRFVIVRRGGLCLLRYDATEWEFHKTPDVKRSLHDHAGDHPCLNRVGFGFTRRAALRRMRKSEESGLSGSFRPVDGAR